MPPRIVNKAIITQTANRGRYLGQLYLLNPGIYDWVDTSTLSSATSKKQKKALEYRLSRVDYLLNRDGNTPETVASLEKQKAIILKQLEADDHENSQQTHTPKSTFKAAFSPLTQNIGEDRRMNEMIKEIKKGAESFTN